MFQVKKKFAENNQLYDLSKLYTISKDEDFIQKMLQIFIKEIPVSVNQIKEAYNKNDLQKIRETAHRIKPSVHNMGIYSLTSCVAQLETFDETTNKNQLLSLINLLEEVINKVVKKLQITTYK